MSIFLNSWFFENLVEFLGNAFGVAITASKFQFCFSVGVSNSKKEIQ